MNLFLSFLAMLPHFLLFGKSLPFRLKSILIIFLLSIMGGNGHKIAAQKKDFFPDVFYFFYKVCKKPKKCLPFFNFLDFEVSDYNWRVTHILEAMLPPSSSLYRKRYPFFLNHANQKIGILTLTILPSKESKSPTFFQLSIQKNKQMGTEVPEKVDFFLKKIDRRKIANILLTYMKKYALLSMDSIEIDDCFLFESFLEPYKPIDSDTCFSPMVHGNPFSFSKKKKGPFFLSIGCQASFSIDKKNIFHRDYRMVPLHLVMHTNEKKYTLDTFYPLHLFSTLGAFFDFSKAHLQKKMGESLCPTIYIKNNVSLTISWKNWGEKSHQVTTIYIPKKEKCLENLDAFTRYRCCHLLGLFPNPNLKKYKNLKITCHVESINRSIYPHKRAKKTPLKGSEAAILKKESVPATSPKKKDPSPKPTFPLSQQKERKQIVQSIYPNKAPIPLKSSVKKGIDRLSTPKKKNAPKKIAQKKRKTKWKPPFFIALIVLCKQLYAPIFVTKKEKNQRKNEKNPP